MNRTLKNRKRFALLLITFFLSVLILSACHSYGPSNRFFTPVPTLIPVAYPNPLQAVVESGVGQLSCRIRAVDLLGAWVGAGVPVETSFEFEDEDGNLCQATFYEDVQQLFLESNLWYEGAPACVSCHNSNLATSFQNMDLSSYESILAGSRRPNGEEKGNDILGGLIWEESLLYYKLINRLMPLGRPPDSPAKGPELRVGELLSSE